MVPVEGETVGDVTVGIDIGTASVKAVAVDADGEVQREARVPHKIIAPHPDRFEHDARAAWVDGVLRAFEAVAIDQEPAGLTVSAMVPSLCGVDEHGVPVTPGLLYGDARGRADAGGRGVEGEAVGFARWLAAQPGVVSVWPAQAVANHALCGVGAIDTSTAMAMAPLFAGNGWDATILADIGLTEEQLPALSPGTAAIGSRGTTTLSGGTIDALAEQYVADARAPGDALVICGTTMIPWVLTDEWREIEGLWTIPYTIPGVIAIGGASNAGGVFIDYVRATVGDVDQDSLVAVDPTDLPVWLPYIRGERTPLHDPARRAELFDLGVGHGPAEIIAAAYEAAGFVVRHHLDLAGTNPTRIVAAGGGINSAAWMHALADCTGLPVDVSEHPMGAALGAAFTSRVTAGLEPDMSGSHRWARIRERVEPRADHVAAADIRYWRFREATAR